MVEVGRRLYARRLIGGNEGNISVRDGSVLYVTPAAVCKGFLAPECIVRTDLEGRPLDGGRASTEVLMHTAVYRRRSDVGAVVHAHPPTATGFAVAGIPLDRPLTAEAVVTLGVVPVIPYGTPSTSELADNVGRAENVGRAICETQTILLANHGALSVGVDLYQAWERMETLEQVARVALVARLLGREGHLPAADVERLAAMREPAGYPPPVCAPEPRPSPTLAAGAEGGPARFSLSREELVRLLAEAIERFRT
ncbi:MAG: class II aldolase family protein [Acidobacteria bacterium]|nr:MAG: class II aldolase family protein [Acidobacteriota bacterium]